MRIVQVANFYSRASGGLRTTMEALADGYARRGHEAILIVPDEGRAMRRTDRPWGTLVQVPARAIPRSGGYRAITDVDMLCTLLDDMKPDALEVADRLTLRPLGWWASASGVPAVMWAHERVDGVLRAFTPPGIPHRLLADAWNRSSMHRFDRVVATTAFAAEEFERIGAQHVVRVPLGVDLTTFTPARRSDELRKTLLGRDSDVLIVTCTRLSKEKRPDLAVQTLQHLRQRGVKARLVVVGTGAWESKVRRMATGLPVTFLGHVSDRHHLAAMLASADIVLSPGPIETFGLAALEAMASGTPVVASRTSALVEIASGAAGQSVAPEPSAFATAVMALLLRPTEGRRRAARQRAEEFPWSRTISAMLDLHGDRVSAWV
jgi:alpha-1,6-mannosyltransferase